MSTLVVTNISDGTITTPSTVVTDGGTTAWWQYDQATPSVHDSYNISSVNDDAAGASTATFTSNVAATTVMRRYGGSLDNTGGTHRLFPSGGTLSTSQVSQETTNSGNTATDNARTGWEVGGQLA